MQDIRQNYAKLVYGIHFPAGVNFTDVYNGFNSRIPTDFHQKFTNLYYVEAVEIRTKNYDDFLDFLSKSPTITAINFKNTELGPELLDRLPAACPALNQLIASKSTLKEDNDYGFLSGLTCLTSLSLNCCTPSFCIELIESLFTQCRYFAVFSATTNDPPNIRIERKNKQFELKISVKEHRCQNIHEVLRLLRECEFP